MPILTPNKRSITQILSSTAISLSISLMAISVAHAEQYCKSVDKDGNATYTLASDKGCNAKKMKTVAVSHHITPGSTSAKTAAAPASTTPAQTTPTLVQPQTAPAQTTSPNQTTPTQTTPTQTTPTQSAPAPVPTQKNLPTPTLTPQM